MPKGNGGVRPILNLADDSGIGKSLNDFIKEDDPDACKVEYIQQLEIVERIRSVGKGGYLWCKDLKWGFNNLPIAEEDVKYLAFEFDGKKWCYQVLPMGLTTAPKSFTEFMHFPIWAIKDEDRDNFYIELDKEDVNTVVFKKDSDCKIKDGKVIISLIDYYLDDIFGGHPEKAIALLQSEIVDRKLRELGLAAQIEKQKGPWQSIDLLGKNYNTVTQRVKLTDKHYGKYTDFIISKILSQRKVSAKIFLQAIGKLRYAASIYRPLSAFVRNLEKWVHTDKNRKWVKGNRVINLRSSINITTPVARDFELCLDMLKLAHKKGASFDSFRWATEKDMKFDVTVYTDAAGSDRLGIGGIASTGEYYQNKWSDVDIFEPWNRDIQWRELVGVYVMIQALHHKWRHKKVHIFTDNMTVKTWLVRRRSKISRPECQILINQIARWEIENEMYLRFDHVPGEENVTADALSRFYRNPLKDAPFTCDKELDCTEALREANHLTEITKYDRMKRRIRIYRD